MLAVALLLIPIPVSAQLLQGSLTGTVTDPSDAAVTGLSVVALNEGTNLTRETQTNPLGDYTFVTLPPGSYTITIKAPGFQAYSHSGVVVRGNEVTRLNVKLSVGQVDQSVTVSGQASQLQTDRGDVRTDLSTRALNELPTPLGRNYQMTLAVVVPGVSTPQSGQSFGANASRSVGYNVNGVSSVSNNVRIDGTSSTNYNATDKPMYSPALESIDTVNVVTNSFDAEQGLAGGAAVNVATKTGGNSIHGAVFGDHTDQHEKAYAWVSDRTQPKPKFLHNQIGGIIGGPIRRDKLFYFVSYEGTFVRQENPIYSQVPTPAMKGGILAASPTPIYDPGTGNANGTGRTAFGGNIIPASRIDPGIQAVIGLNNWPNANVPGTGAFGLARNYLSAGNNGQSRNQFDSKLTWNASRKLSMFARMGINVNDWFNPQQYGSLGGPGYSSGNTAVGLGEGHLYSGTVSGTYIFNPNLIADAYYGYSRNNAFTEPQGLDQNLGWTLLKIPGLQSSQRREGGLPALMIDGFGGTASNLPEATIGPANNFQPQVISSYEQEFVGNLTWIRGRHNIRAGADLVQQRITENFEQATFCSFCSGAGGFQFSQGTTQLSGGPGGNDFNAFASFLLGLPANTGKVTLFPPEYHAFSKIFGSYVRDQWQVNRKLTFTYGARFEYYPYENRGSRGMEYLDAKNNLLILCGVGSTPKNCGITKDTFHVVPRVGLAYRLNDTTVIRAGYGWTTDPTNLGGVLGNRQNYPEIVATTLAAPNSFGYSTTLRIGVPAIVQPDTSSGSVALPKTAGVYSVDNDNYVRGYIQSWNAVVEHQRGSWIASGGYVATRSIDPISNLNGNWGPIGTGSAGQVLNVLAGRTAITNIIGTMGTNKFDSLQATVSRRPAKGIQFSGTYSFAHAYGYTSQIAIPSNFSLNYGNLGTVARQTIGLTMVAESPFGKGRMWLTSGLGAMILGGWQFQVISTLRSGTPFTVTASNTTLNASGSTQFADCIAPAKRIGDIFQWYDKTTFASPTAGRFGTCTTNSLWGPGLINADTGIVRMFKIRERMELKFRAEMFNTANTPHHSNPTNSITSGTFMQALGIANTGREGIDERTLRLSLRFAF